jgi:hypothetical protein
LNLSRSRLILLGLLPAFGLAAAFVIFIIWAASLFDFKPTALPTLAVLASQTRQATLVAQITAVEPTATTPATALPTLTAAAPTPLPESSSTAASPSLPPNAITATALPAQPSAPPTPTVISATAVPVAASSATNLPTFTRPPVTPTLTQRCIAIVGDSVAQGDAVFEIPGTGFFKARFAAVANFLQNLYLGRGSRNTRVVNRAASAVGVSSSKHPSYFSTVEYAQLLQDRCQFVVIIPWINDLSSGAPPAAAATAHVQALGNLVRAVSSARPDTRFLILNYYNAAPKDWALRTFATGFTSDAVATFNGQIAAACSGGALTSPQINCVDSNAVFAGIGNYLIGPLNQQELNASLVAPVEPDAAGLLSAYFGGNPGGQVNGDGVHLSNPGKAALAQRLLALMP